MAGLAIGELRLNMIHMHFRPTYRIMAKTTISLVVAYRAQAVVAGLTRRRLVEILVIAVTIPAGQFRMLPHKRESHGMLETLADRNHPGEILHDRHGI